MSNNKPKYRRCNRWHILQAIQTQQEYDDGLYGFHKSCWTCEHIEVAKFPLRRCALDHGIDVPTSGPDEIDQKTHKTIADDCPNYIRCREFRPENHRMIIVSIEDIEKMNKKNLNAIKQNLLYHIKDEDNGIYYLIVWDDGEEE